MSETEKPFTVSDRRHFTPEGRPRDEAEEARAGDGDAARTAPQAERAGQTGARADLSTFLVGLAAQAGAFLSGEGLPEGMGPPEALEGARSVIAVLEMLKDKTEGRRTAAEDTLLDELLFQLRMAYVEKTRAGGA